PPRVARRESADHHPRRLLPGQEAQQPQRPCLQVRRFALLHRSALWAAHPEGRRSGEAAQGQRRLSYSPRAPAEAGQRTGARRVATSRYRSDPAQRNSLLTRRKISLREQLRTEKDMDALSRAARRLCDRAKVV